MLIGTAHFISRTAAVRYYAAYGHSAADVDAKLAAGECHVGVPHAERVRLNREEGRYFIDERGDVLSEAAKRQVARDDEKARLNDW